MSSALDTLFTGFPYRIYLLPLVVFMIGFALYFTYDDFWEAGQEELIQCGGLIYQHYPTG
jgi:hypothetical protein